MFRQLSRFAFQGDAVVAVLPDQLTKSCERIPYTASTVRLSTFGRHLADNECDRHGVTAERLDSPYLPGERAMVKVERMREWPTASSAAFAISPGGAKLIPCCLASNGKLGQAGFTPTISNDERASLFSRLEALREPQVSPRRARSTKPLEYRMQQRLGAATAELVVEVRFDHVTGCVSGMA